MRGYPGSDKHVELIIAFKGVTYEPRKSRKSAYDQNEAVRAISDHMTARDRNQTETKLSRILRHLTNDGVDLRRSEVIAAFCKLEETRCGKCIEGHHGWPSRFVWDVKNLEVSAAAKGTQSLAPSAAEDCGDRGFRRSGVDRTLLCGASRPHDLDRTPADLSKREAARLAAFVHSLPFGEEG